MYIVRICQTVPGWFIKCRRKTRIFFPEDIREASLYVEEVLMTADWEKFEQVEQSSDNRCVLWRTACVLVFDSSFKWVTFLFLMLFCSISAHFSEIQLVCDRPTDGPTDGRTDGPTDPLIEMRERI